MMNLLTAGAAGTLALSAFVEAWNRLFGTQLDLARGLGSFVTGDARSPATLPVGLTAHALVGAAAIPLGYDAAFRAIGRRGAGTGAVLGLAHGVASGAVLPWLERANGEICDAGPLAARLRGCVP